MRFATRRSDVLPWGLAQRFENVKAEFEAEDADRGLGIEPGGDEDDDRSSQQVSRGFYPRTPNPFTAIHY